MYGDDDTHITGQITFSQIAEAIRHKKYGRDMREAIAQGFERFIGLLGRVSKLESEYSDLLGKYNDVIGRLNDDETEVHDLQGDVKALTKKHNDDIDALNKVIASQDERIAKLEKAVFEAQYINDTDDVADHDKSVVLQDINDTNVVDDDGGLIIEQDNYKSLPSDIS